MNIEHLAGRGGRQVGTLGSRYTGLAIALHWTTTCLVLALVVIGFPLSWTPFPSVPYDKLHWWHRSLGELTLLVVLVTLVWRWRNPAPVNAHIPYWQARTAEVTRWTIYILLIALALMKLVRGAFGLGYVFFGLTAGPLFPANKVVGPIVGQLHYASVLLLLFFISLHVTGALWHAVVKRDHILSRMLPSSRR